MRVTATVSLVDAAIHPDRVWAQVAPTSEYPERFEVMLGTMRWAFVNDAQFDDIVTALLAAKATLPSRWRQHRETQRILDAARDTARKQVTTA